MKVICVLSGSIGVELGDHGGGDVQRAVFFIQAVGRFDLAHFLARRNVDAEACLDETLFFNGGFEQVEPGGFLGQGRVVARDPVA